MLTGEKTLLLSSSQQLPMTVMIGEWMVMVRVVI